MNEQTTLTGGSHRTAIPSKTLLTGKLGDNPWVLLLLVLVTHHLLPVQENCKNDCRYKTTQGLFFSHFQGFQNFFLGIYKTKVRKKTGKKCLCSITVLGNVPISAVRDVLHCRCTFRTCSFQSTSPVDVDKTFKSKLIYKPHTHKKKWAMYNKK